MPPPDNVPLVHKVSEFYKQLCVYSLKIPKRARFGIYLKIENVCLEILHSILTASFQAKTEKLPTLNAARVQIEALKILVRITCELKIINQQQYLYLEKSIQEISKMTNGWIKYLRL